MKAENINNSPSKLRILVAPLDWGLGHATRCIPLIHALLKHNTEVLLAAQGPIRILLKNEFPTLKMLDLKGYNIRYSRHKNLFILNLITQLPKLFFAIQHERKWLKKIIKEERIAGVISDNRPGLQHDFVSCVYITHQLQIQSGHTTSDAWLRKMHYRFINKFQQCWIPDNEGNSILAGALSHPKVYPATPCKYLGVLSRFEKKAAENKYDFLLLLSGPEPQRTALENQLLNAFDNGQHSFALVRGLPSVKNIPALKSMNAKIFNHLPAHELNELILQSDLIIARAGYSTIMDLIKLHKRAVLIATPGQTEQEYLATYLEDKKIFAAIRQEDISYENIQFAAKEFTMEIPAQNTEMHEEVVTDWLATLL